MFDSFHLNRNLGDLTSRERAFLALIAVGAGALYLGYAFERPLIGDEAGTYLYLQKDATFILTHFKPWLTQNYFILVEKLIYEGFGEHLFLLRALPLACALGSIVAVAAVSIRLVSPNAALITTLLTAFNPFIVEFSSVARAYSILVFLCFTSFLLFLRWREKPSFARAAAVACSFLLLLLMHPNGAYFAVPLGMMAGIDVATGIRRRGEWRLLRHALVLSGLVGIAAVAIVAAYWNIVPEMEKLFGEGGRFHSAPPASISYLPVLFEQYFGARLRWILSFALAILGIVYALRTRPALLWMWSFIAVPVALMSLTGLSHHPWAYGRFIIFTIPIFILFISLGMESIATLPALRRWKYAIVVLAAVQLAFWLPRIDHLFRSKTDQHRVIPANLRARFPEGRVVTSPHAVEILQLKPYLDQIPEFENRSVPLSNVLAPGFEANRLALILRVRQSFALPDRFRRVGRYAIGSYDAASREQLLRQVQADLVTISGGRVDPILADYYSAIIALIEASGSREDTSRYELLLGRSMRALP